MKILSKEQVIKIHSMLISKTGGLNGIRDNGLLESALAAPFQTFDEQELYPTSYSKAARLGYSLVNNHPFVDGNKRIGILVMLTYLELNGILLNVTDEELIQLGLDLASGKIQDSHLLEWIIKHDND